MNWLVGVGIEKPYVVCCWFYIVSNQFFELFLSLISMFLPMRLMMLFPFPFFPTLSSILVIPKQGLHYWIISMLVSYFSGSLIPYLKKGSSGNPTCYSSRIHGALLLLFLGRKRLKSFIHSSRQCCSFRSMSRGLKEINYVETPCTLFEKNNFLLCLEPATPCFSPSSLAPQ
jgi:hypothetical protein